MDPPPHETLVLALEQLYALGALNHLGELTKVTYAWLSIKTTAPFQYFSIALAPFPPPLLNQLNKKKASYGYPISIYC